MDPVTITLLAIGVIGLGLKAWSTWDNHKANEEAAQDRKEGLYNDAKATLTSLQSQYDQLVSVDIRQDEADIKFYNDKIALWQQDYNAQVGAANAEISTYDNFLANWQGSYNAQVTSAELEGKSNFTHLLENWSDAEALAADRGMGGSMNLIANQEKSKVVDYAGSDLSLAGNDGLFGLEMNSLRRTLNTNKSQAENQKSVLTANLANLRAGLNNELAGYRSQLEVERSSLEMNTSAAQKLIDETIPDQEKTVAKLKKEAGL